MISKSDKIIFYIQLYIAVSFGKFEVLMLNCLSKYTFIMLKKDTIYVFS